jgi:hypothetical protein
MQFGCDFLNHTVSISWVSGATWCSFRASAYLLVPWLQCQLGMMQCPHCTAEVGCFVCLFLFVLGITEIFIGVSLWRAFSSGSDIIGILIGTRSSICSCT